ncbi:MAG: hypothetical protein JWN43_1610 [Gammaproteobacteria bacterium]|nr:hypothetical protein [Gammaproteobacteria bacterium]
MPQRIAIVGAGFCGTVLAVNLLRRPPPNIAEIVLIERSSAMGRGVAYAIRDCPYLLNVPAGRLSADSRDPQQFLRFAQGSLPHAHAEDFLPRQVYGDYLQESLRLAERERAGGLALVRVFGEVTHISRTERDGPLMLKLSGGDTLAAQRTILALGNPPPPLLPWAEAARNHPAYHDDPWTLPPDLDGHHEVLIIGNGLTMVDVAFSLTRDAARAPRLRTISRRGLIPLPQSSFHASAIRGGAEFFDDTRSIRQIVAASRALAREVDRLGGDWREVVTFIRNSAASIWQRLPECERRRFLRHLQSHWDVHRHRMPPQLAAHVDGLRRRGLLEINAGRIDGVSPDGDRLRVRWRPRGGAPPKTFLADAVINATGPDYVLSRSRNALLQSLRSAGWISEDALGLGLRTTPQAACVGADGSASERLFYLGPMLRAGHWEATAATELRNHAEALAHHLAERGA